MNPFSNPGCIQMRITRDENAENDDRIAIRYKDEDCYQIFFQDGNTDRKKTYCTVLTGQQVDCYIDSLFTLLSRDNDPFFNINFMIPCMPVVQYSIQDLRKGKLRKTLKNILPVLQSAAEL